MTTTTTTKPDATKVFVCLSGYISKQGSFAEGMTVRGSDPAVQAHPQFWAPADLTDAELALAKHDLAHRS